MLSVDVPPEVHRKAVERARARKEKIQRGADPQFWPRVVHERAEAYGEWVAGLMKMKPLTRAKMLNRAQAEVEALCAQAEMKCGWRKGGGVDEE